MKYDDAYYDAKEDKAVHDHIERHVEHLNTFDLDFMHEFQVENFNLTQSDAEKIRCWEVVSRIYRESFEEDNGYWEDA